MGYCVQSLPLALALRVMDFMLALLPRRPQTTGSGRSEPLRIVVANGAHLGDVVLCTAVLGPLRERFPGAEIGFVTGSWSKVVLEGHPLIDRIHVVDHWRLDRSGAPMRSRLVRYLRTRARALRELRAIRYDIAIDLYFHFPNSALLFYQAGMPTRIGYESGGGAPVTTRSLGWLPGRGSVIDYLRELLQLLPHMSAPRPGLQCEWKPTLPRLSGQVLPPGNHVVIHVGSGHRTKLWPLQNWQQLAQELAANGYSIVLVGAGQQEAVTCALIGDVVSGAVNLCNKLSWPEFVSAIAEARLLIGLDSVAAHIAAAVDTPSIVIANGIVDQRLWKPPSALNVVLRKQVECSPCYRSHGCESMECLRGVLPDTVMEVTRHSFGNVAAPPVSNPPSLQRHA